MMCAISDCEKRARKRGWCDMHYERWRKYGDPLVTLRQGLWASPANPRTELQRFWSKVLLDDGCWLWQGALSSVGYPQFALDERTPKRRARQIGAHVYSYVLFKGPVAAGLHLDHLCRTPACVNPDHLEAVTPRTNTLRGVGPAARNAVATHCIRGHEFNAENTWFDPKRRTRHCRPCVRERRRLKREVA